jgi:hypothetical protein
MRYLLSVVGIVTVCVVYAIGFVKGLFEKDMRDD